MSNHVPLPAGFGITPSTTGDGRIEGDVIRHDIDMDLPNGKQAIVSLRIGTEGPADAEARREEFLATTYAPSLTEGLEKEVARLTELFNDFTGYDKQGKAIMRVTGREREVLEMKLANRTNALRLARAERQRVEQYQEQARRKKEESEARINAAALLKAQDLIEQEEIDRRAQQIAARAGVGRR